MDAKNVSQQQRKMGEIFASRMASYPLEVNMTMGTALFNIMKGCPWVIMSGENTAFLENLDLFQKGGMITAYRLKDKQNKASKENPRSNERYLVTFPMKRMVEILNKEGFGVFKQEDLNHALEKRDEAINRLNGFLKAGKTGEIGIFSTNEGREIIVNGISYPAFDITLVDLISYCTMYGYKFLIGGKRFEPKILLDNLTKVYENLHVAPSESALMVKIVK